MKYSLLKLSAIAAIMNPANAAFRGGSFVTTPDGVKKIKHLEVGDHVDAYSPLTDARGRAVVLAKALSEEMDSIIDIDLGHKTVRTLAHQKVFDMSGHYFIRAKDLSTDKSVLLGEDGSPLNVVGIRKRRKSSCCSSSNPYEVTIDTRDHAFFVDGILCHNGGELSTMGGEVADLAKKESIKKTVLKNLKGPDGVAMQAVATVGGIYINEVMKEEPNPYTFNPFYVPEPGSEAAIMRDIMHEKPAAAPVIEVAPAAAPKRRVNQDAVQKWRQANPSTTALRAARMIEPGPCNGPRAVIQIPNMGPQRPFPGTAEAIKLEAHERAIQERRNDPRTNFQIERDERNALKAEQKQKELQEQNDRVEALIRAGKEIEEKRLQQAAEKVQHAADKRAAQKEQMEGRAAAIEKAGAKTEQERRLAVEEYDNLQRMNFIHRQLAPNINKPLPPRVMASVKKSLERAAALQDQMIAAREAAAAKRADTSSSAEIRAMPPHIGINFLTKTGHQAQENNRQREMQEHQEQMRQLEEQRRMQAQQRIDQARNAESSQKAMDAERNRLQREEILKQRLLAMVKPKN